MVCLLIELQDRCRMGVKGALLPPTEDRGFHDAGCATGFHFESLVKGVKYLPSALKAI
jgi:hypothetical protein